MANLEVQRKEVQIIINFPIHNDLPTFEYNLSNCGFSYAYIVHDKDIHECDKFRNVKDGDGKVHREQYACKGEPKTRHIHLVLCCLKRHQLKYYLHLVTDALGVNDDQVSIQPCESVAYAIQYLIHKNDPTKHRYNIVDIHTNMSEGTLNDYLNADVMSSMSSSDIIKLIVESHGDKLRIIETIGLSRYILYRNAINDIYHALGYRLDNYKYDKFTGLVNK